jgi:CHAT domain-containing protein
VSLSIRWRLFLSCVWPALLCGAPAQAGAAKGGGHQELVFKRLSEALTAMPARWADIPGPRVAVSGRSCEAILEAATAEQIKAAEAAISRLARVRPGRRKEVIEQLLQAGASEVDLCAPWQFVDRLRGHSIPEASLVVEAWMAMLEQAGRRDILHLAAGRALEFIAMRSGAREALPLSEQWAKIPWARNEERARAWVITVQAYMLFRLLRIEESLEIFQRARATFVREGSLKGEARVLRNESEVLFYLGRNEESLEFRRRARKIAAAVGDKSGEARSTAGEADVYATMIRYEEALPAWQHARRLFRELGDKAGEGRTIRSEAEVLLRLQRYEEALQGFRQAYELQVETGNRYDAVPDLLGQASALLYMGHNQEALQAYRKARALAGSVWYAGVGQAVFGEATALLRLGRQQDAYRRFQHARGIFARSGDRQGEAEALIGEARSLPVRERCGGPAAPLDRALRLLAAFDPKRSVYALVMLAVCLRARSDHAGALKHAEQAFSHQLSIAPRTYGLGDWDRTILLEGGNTQTYRSYVSESGLSSVYAILIPLLAEQDGREAEALIRAEEAHSPVLLDLLKLPFGRPPQIDDESLRRERLQLLQQLAALPRSPSTASPPQQQRVELERQLEWNEYRQFVSAKTPLLTARSLGLQEIYALARDAGPLLLYYVSEDEVVGFLVLPGQHEPIVHISKVPRERLKADVLRLRYDLANSSWEGRSHIQARTLWDVLIAPIQGHLTPYRHLVIVPHGPLHDLPFESLADPAGAPLLTHWNVSVAPSLSVLATLRSRQRSAERCRGSFLALAAGDGLHLPDREVEQISTLFGANQVSFHRGQSHIGVYRDMAPRTSHLLITTHGLQVENSRWGSYLELEPTELHDGRLRQAEIATHTLECAELVTLSACDTARGEAVRSGERLDFVRAFLIAGAGAVLATRWQVPEDEATVQFLVDFYRAYLGPGTAGQRLRKDEALTEARRKAIARDTPAQIWAAWVLVGDAR